MRTPPELLDVGGDPGQRAPHEVPPEGVGRSKDAPTAANRPACNAFTHVPEDPNCERCKMTKRPHPPDVKRNHTSPQMVCLLQKQ